MKLSKPDRHNERALSYERLLEVLSYSPETGAFTWRTDRPNGSKAGDAAGYLNSKGYVSIGIDGRIFAAHRVAFLYMKRSWPPKWVDHKNRDRRDNKWTNIRVATPAENKRNCVRHRNNACGYKGVHYRAERDRWRAFIRVDGRLRHHGHFKSPEAANEAYCNAARLYFKEFAHF